MADDRTASTDTGEPLELDVDRQVPARRRESFRQTSSVLLAIAIGGMLGAAARHGAEVVAPASSSGVPWAIFVVNLSGSALIGVLMVLLEVGSTHRLLRPFLGVGVLGGYTTFSAYAVDVQQLLIQDRPAVALGYLIGTAVGALMAVMLGVFAARAGIRLRAWIRRRVQAHRKEPP